MTLRIAAQWTVGAALALVGSAATAHNHSHEGRGEQLLVRYQMTNYESAMRAIGRLHLDTAGVDINSQTIDIVADAESHKLVEAISGVTATLVVPTAAVDAPDEGYHTSQEVEAELRDLAAKFPSIVHLESIGKSVEGRDIWAVKISDNPTIRETEEPTMLYNSMHHAREVMTTEVAMDTAEFLTERYGQDPQVTNWVDNNEIWIVPMLNVDGNNKVWTANSMWRKNTRGGYGVDLNRNYPYKWNTCGGSSGSTWSQTYRGPSPASEPETRALMNLVERVRPVFNISYHSYSEMVLYPYGCQGEHTATREIVEGIGIKMAEALPSDRSSGHYTPGTPWEILYSVDGGDVDWMYGEYGVIPYVIELNSTSEGFQPSYSRWRDVTVEKMRSAWSMLLDRVEGSGIRGLVNISNGRNPSDIKVRIESLDKPMLVAQTLPLNPDGTFHFVVKPGMYSISLTDGQFTLPPNNVQVDADRVELDLDF